MRKAKSGELFGEAVRLVRTPCQPLARQVRATTRLIRSGDQIPGIKQIAEAIKRRLGSKAKLFMFWRSQVGKGFKSRQDAGKLGMELTHRIDFNHVSLRLAKCGQAGQVVKHLVGRH